MSSPRAHLVDASIYVFRAWHRCTPDRFDRDGEPVHAVLGFAAFLLELLERERPRALALVFDDRREHCDRRAIYPAYKSGRPSAPPELRRQFQDCRALARAAGLPEFASQRVEGDDVLATLAANPRRQGWRHTVISGDKDLAQLVRTGDEWWDYERDRRLDMRGIRRKFGVAPHQIPDLLALAGDPGDSIPGVPGVGRPTAARLLRRWEDLDGVFANLDRVRVMQFRGAPQVAARLREYEATVRMARRLTGALHAEGLPETPEALIPAEPDRDALEALFARLGFTDDERRRWTRVLDAGVPA
ncbi:MAG: 5'-3' exonuclease H3TH domain-containing protein [Halofilum sp. (in: g-proteobacteria)]